MRTQKISLLVTLAICLLAFSFPWKATAGGWAVITLDELPEDPVAGQSLTIGFTVLQHGRTPMVDLTPTITLENQANSESLRVTAHPEGHPGHYSAELLIPAEGTWDWSIQAFTMDQPMPPLLVRPGSQASIAGQSDSPLSLQLVLGIIALVCLGSALILLVRTRLRWALVLLVAGLLVGGAGFAYAANQPSVSLTELPISLSQVKTGQHLFVSKGCMTCHAHEQIDRDIDGAIFVDSGPDLSEFSADPDYLRRWLADPGSIKPGTEMPDLNLDQAEIEALISFLNSD